MMPVVFIGHGSPMNAIEENEFTEGWKSIANSIPQPSVILSISAHWVTDGTKVLMEKSPRTIHDFYGFPKALYDIKYPAPGSPETGDEILSLLGEDVTADISWGIDHGTWSLLHKMYPDANIPTLQLSLNYQATPAQHYALGQKLQSLRKKGVLILGTGNIVHNLMLLDFSVDGGFDWAYDFDSNIKEAILAKDHEKAIQYSQFSSSRHAVPTSEHYNPLLYVLGAVQEDDQVQVYNESYLGGSLSMTSYLFTK